MAKTKAKAKVKPVVKNKAKAAPKKADPKKSAAAKKGSSKKAAPKKATPIKAAKKAKPELKKILAKKASPAKKQSKPDTKKIVKPEVKSKNKTALKPVAKAVDLKPSKKPTKEKPAAKRAEVITKEVGGKKIKMDFPKKRAGRKPKNKGDEDDGFELLEVPKLEPINKKAPKKKFIIPVNPEVYVNPHAKQVALPKNMGTYKKFEMEFPIHASPYIIYSFISTPAGLSEWFAENVNIRNDEFTFLWDGSQQTATLLSKKENTFMKFRWNDEPDFTFFEFRIVVDEITQDVAFWVTDFAEDEKSKEASEMLWNSQIDALIHAMGA